MAHFGLVQTASGVLVYICNWIWDLRAGRCATYRLGTGFIFLANLISVAGVIFFAIWSRH